MLLSSWNVNSVRARIENIKSYLLKYKPDILMMQEIKTEDMNFPYDDFSAMDYESQVFGQKSYNGVAIISKGKFKNIRTDLIKDKLKQSRILSAEIEYKKKIIQLINIYTPNGNPVDTEKYDYKKKWMDQLIKQLKTLSKKDKGSFFRIAIKGGGCSGFQYEFTFDQSMDKDDLNFENILIDKTSADLLKGSEIDYVSELIGEQFKITNPQTKSSCGCGVSFSI